MSKHSGFTNNSIEDEQFLNEVFPKEIEVIKKRRNNNQQSTEKLTAKPTVKQDLVGLAFSGGGIRSATFSLGATQALHDAGVFNKVDYLSTVSGGGFTGSCISSLLNDKKTDDDFPLGDVHGTKEKPAISHLRNSSNYLAPGGFIDNLRIPTLLLRGILLNLLLILGYIMIAVIFTDMIYRWIPASADYLHFTILGAALTFILLILLFPLLSRWFRKKFRWTVRNGYERTLAVVLLVLISAAILIPLTLYSKEAIETSFSNWLGQLQFFDDYSDFEGLMMLGGVIMMVTMSMIASKASKILAKLGGKLLLYFFGLLGPLLIYATYLVLVILFVQSPKLTSDVTNDITAGTSSNALYLELVSRGPEWEKYSSFTLQPLAAVLSSPLTDTNRNNASKNYCPDQSHCAQLASPLQITNHYIVKAWQLYAPENSKSIATIFKVVKNADNTTNHQYEYYIAYPNGIPNISPWFYGLTLLLFLFNIFLVDVNINSIHGFYRDRLSKAYLIQQKSNGDIQQNDRQSLQHLNNEGSVAPYHLINATLNLQASQDPALRGREADFFIFSKCYVGGPRTGYCATEKICEVDPHINLGTAFAISGAAASPNMGTTTAPTLVFILTMLNIRLGYWLPNPSHVRNAGYLKRKILGLPVNTMYIIKEALSKLNAQGNRINVSDGGHLENLGIYELLRRRCKYIIAVDGEADPDMTFGSMISLLRYARIDLGLEVDIDLNKLRLTENGYSQTHWAIATIHYGEEEKGQLLYIKSSLSGDEDVVINDYKQRNPSYPHESTADQFFDEAQFEAYRSLGKHIVRELFSSPDQLGPFKDLLSERRSIRNETICEATIA